jgi:alpha-galactosidase
MGYNTWNDFRCTSALNESSVMAVADKMVELGLVDIGYEYLNIDDCWNVGRFPNGTLMPDPVAFPNGIKPVADYVHSKVVRGLHRNEISCIYTSSNAGIEVRNVH